MSNKNFTGLVNSSSSSTFDVVFGFDMETDIGSYTPFYDGVQHGTAPVLDILEKHKIPATFYWTGHAAEKNPKMLIRVAKGGHETGCHGLFHETLGDELFPLPNNWPILPSEVAGRLERATNIITNVLGERPVSFRCPRLWGSTQVVNVLEDLGYVSDASLPLYFYGNPITPYHPSSTDWTKKGSMKIVEIPNFCDLDMESDDPYQRDRDQWPLFRTKGADALIEKCEKFISYVSSYGERPVLCFYFHPWEFYPMPTDSIDLGECKVTPNYFIVENCGDYALSQFNKLCEQLKNLGGRFMTAGDLVKAY